MISNSSDAIDKIRFESQKNPDILGDDTEFKIKLIADKDNNALIVSDNGIGMTRDELIENIGTIAHSGTQSFLKMLQENKEALTPELIGQFGVGFYSAFMVAKEVRILTRSAKSDQAWEWISKGDGTYVISEAEKESRGTEVTVSLKKQDEGDMDLTQDWSIRSIVKRHSDFVGYPIVMDVEKEVPTDDDKDDDDQKKDSEILGPDGKPADKEPEILDQDGKPIEQKPEKIIEEETLNSMKAIWAKSKNEVKDDEYKEFYKHLSHDPGEPMEWIHMKMEGATEYDALLYIPGMPPFDLFNRDKKHGVDLYCKRVFIMHDCQDLMPEYMRFIKGVVDSSDLDLNVSREMLQQNHIVRNIKKNIVKKVLDTLAAMDDEKYKKFYDNFGITLKEGIHTDWENKEKLSDLLRYKTSKSDDKMISLKDYVDHMPSDQNEIYYLTGEKISTLMNSPAIEKLKEKNYEVLLMVDYVDEWVVQSLTEYKGKKLRSAEKGDLNIDKVDDKKKEEFSDLFEHIKKTLDNKVKDVKPSVRLKESVSCLAGDEYDMSSYMEKIMKSAGHDSPSTKRILEINMDHPITVRLNDMFKANKEDEKVSEFIQIIYDLAVIGEGGKVENPGQFISKVGNMMVNTM
ncbi:MAG: molecular chaperone HtpG [Candidatus Magnetoglobus multicellularis str. Araruama]|uniref:Chaperone protein HtpG n=1 Tax=Candidatus Magnetoglobus multicellularis str. Araruama TaxID=890399 RepID=A0A1V1P212_9BACT|nr:MAG: molecular chaperone HtpG [Candidatus Magnetoglobus multicellularis str. Araruama]